MGGDTSRATNGENLLVLMHQSNRELPKAVKAASWKGSNTVDTCNIHPKNMKHLCGLRIDGHASSAFASGQQLTLLRSILHHITWLCGIKSSIWGFDRTNLTHLHPKENKAMIYFLNRFYFYTSLGSLFAVTVLLYIQDNVGRGWGDGISAGTVALAVAVLLGWNIVVQT
ncbi:hypothetical protein HAX54_005838 [Datura stramonium]|uniref:Uncharacterized protein n=1 Tax=Datura stramonium TaxID=4076 RepID=A0ABS8TAN9_DATST|nr:hypothetical protein [Datura stramonium]